MATVFIAGSIKIKRLDKAVKDRLDRIIDLKFDIVVGDADGADTSIQSHLFEREAKLVTVFCSGEKPRNNVGEWKIRKIKTQHTPGTRSFFTAKDIEMARAADYGFMIWDAKSTGTLSNVIELLQQKKKTVVFVNKEKVFLTVGGTDQLDELIGHMSAHALSDADQKIKLRSRVEALRHEQHEIFCG